MSYIKINTFILILFYPIFNAENDLYLTVTVNAPDKPALIITSRPFVPSQVTIAVWLKIRYAAVDPVNNCVNVFAIGVIVAVLQNPKLAVLAVELKLTHNEHDT